MNEDHSSFSQLLKALRAFSDTPSPIIHAKFEHFRTFFDWISTSFKPWRITFWSRLKLKFPIQNVCNWGRVLSCKTDVLLKLWPSVSMDVREGHPITLFNQSINQSIIPVISKLVHPFKLLSHTLIVSSLSWFPTLSWQHLPNVFFSISIDLILLSPLDKSSSITPLKLDS